MLPVTLYEVKNYLRIIYDDDDLLLKTLINAADEYLKAAIHDNYAECSRAKLLILLVVSDLYDNRGLNEGVSVKVRNIVDNFALQMKLQKRGGLQ